MSRRVLRRTVGVCLVIALAGIVHLAQARWIDSRQAEIGARLFAGEEDSAPVARLRGHAQPLPAIASRCANCHRDPSGNGPADAFGGRLDGERLAVARPRRGGPAVAYDEARLCRLLREGIDPNDVIVDAAMPRYVLDDSQCRALWRHLSRRSANEPAREGA